MKKNYIVLLLAILFTGIATAQESQKNFINYQGVARNSDNALMSSEAMTINIALKFGNASATSVYEESHAVMTDANGVFSLLIGNGSPAKGNYNTLPWGSAATFVTVSMNGNEIGTTEMMAVPYALSAGNVTNPSADEVLYDNSTSGLRAMTTQDAIDELVTSGSVDADADPSNEFQTLAFDAGTNELSLSDGNTVTIPSGGTDEDADPTNEIQTISFDAASNKISLTDGGEITIPSGGTDADADPENELQTLSFDAGTNELSLSDGNSIVIPTGGVDGDGDSTNEIQTISFDAGTNELSLSDGGTVTLPSGGTDADADPRNEIQDISLVGTELSISDGSTIDLAPIVPPGGTDNQNLTFDEATKILEIEDGNTVDLSSLSSGGGSSLWTPNGSNISYTSGRVGIGSGSESSNATLEVAGFANSEGILNVKDTEILGRNLAISGFGIQGRFEGANSSLSLNRNGGSIYMGSDVGIGLTGLDSPQSTLDVDGNIRSRDLSGGGNVVADADGNLVIGSAGGSSLWEERGSNIYYNSGNIGLGLTNPQNAWMHIQTNSTVSKPQLLLEEEGNDYARLGLKNDQSNSFWHIAGITRDGASGPENSQLNFYFNDGAAGNNRMTILGNGNVGVNTTAPNSTLDVAGSFNIRGDFVNQSVHKKHVYPFLGSPGNWTPPSSASGNEVTIPGVEMNINVPQGSKVLVSFSAEAAIDADYVSYRIKRDGNTIAFGRQGYYTIGGKAVWHVDLDALDVDVTPGNHTYSVTVYHSDDADDGWWREIVLYAVVIKE